ncbi:hypothetical protein JCM3775_000920 [Rhodotorula graminis]
MLVKVPLVAAAAFATAVSAVAVPADIELMKKSYIERLHKRSTSLAKRNSLTTGVSDATILNFALALEHLEDTWYKMALEKFTAADFEAAGYTGLYPLLEQVSRDETSHVGFLKAALEAAGATPVQACNYSFPLTTVKDFLSLSQVVEGVGVSAYLGAAGAIHEPDYVTAAGSILTVEARHNAFVRFLNNYTPFPQPYDTPLSATNVVTIVTPFFDSCPEGSAPTIKGKSAINVTTTEFTLGGTLELVPADASAVPAGTTVYCGFATGLEAAFTLWEDGSCKIPTENITTGQTYVLVTTGPSLEDKYTLAGPAIIDTTPQNTSVTIPGLENSAASGASSAVASATSAAGSAVASSAPASASPSPAGLAAATNAAVSGKQMAGAAGLFAALVGGLAVLL